MLFSRSLESDHLRRSATRGRYGHSGKLSRWPSATNEQMKQVILALVSTALAPLAFSADYSVFRICEDQRVIRTADGAEAGHIEYIVLEPSSQRIVSTVVTGGVIGEKYVSIPFGSVRFAGEREITLTEINRERLISAPTIERTQLTSVIQPTVIEKTYNHFGVRADVNINNTNVQNRTTVNNSETDINRSDRTDRNNRPDRPNRNDHPGIAGQNDPDNPNRTAQQPGRTSTGGPTNDQSAGKTTRNDNERNPNRNENSANTDSNRSNQRPNASENANERSASKNGEKLPPVGEKYPDNKAGEPKNNQPPAKKESTDKPDQSDRSDDKSASENRTKNDATSERPAGSTRESQSEKPNTAKSENTEEKSKEESASKSKSENSERPSNKSTDSKKE